MRSYLIGTAAVVAVLGAATASVAMSRRGFEQSFGTTNAARPTGMSLTLAWSGGSRARRDASVDDVLPRGARLDTAARARCRATTAQIANAGEGACPAGSRVGHGRAKLRLSAKGSPDIDATVAAFNSRGGLILVVDPAGANIQVLRARVRGGGRRLHLKLPVLCAPTGTVRRCPPGGDVRIVRLHLAIDRLARRGGKGYVTTPPRCSASHRWTFRVRFNGRDGRTRTRTSRVACRS
jgi:hypothetical protein